jgi:hypothetical protein
MGKRRRKSGSASNVVGVDDSRPIASAFKDSKHVRSDLKNPFALSPSSATAGGANTEPSQPVIARRKQGRRGDPVAHGFRSQRDCFVTVFLAMTAVLFVESRAPCPAVEV